MEKKNQIKEFNENIAILVNKKVISSLQEIRDSYHCNYLDKRTGFPDDFRNMIQAELYQSIDRKIKDLSKISK